MFACLFTRHSKARARVFAVFIAGLLNATLCLSSYPAYAFDSFDPVGGNTIAVWRPSEGNWYVLNRVTCAVRVQQWGMQGDIPVPADYDGDGTTDFAVWRPSNGTWYVINSSDGAYWSVQWGAQGDIPVPGNYFTFPSLGVELAVYRPSEGNWYVVNTTTWEVHVKQWGVSNDIPVPGHYNITNRPFPSINLSVPAFAVWRPSSGTWFVKNTGDGAVRTQQWGTQGDIPVPADYDRDGRTDFAVWRPSNGTWYVINSWNGAIRTQQWGLPGDIPVPSDYDHDAKTDFAIWRPSTGTWWIINSSDGSISSQQWGTQGDIPVFYYVAPPPVIVR